MAFGRRWVAAAALVLLAGGCSDDEPDPEFQPPSESSAPTSPTESPSSGPSRQPWERKTEAGAVAFAKHWVDVFSEAVNGGNSAQLRRVSAPMCEACSAISDRVDQIEAEGGYYKTPGWRVLEATASEAASASQMEVVLRVLQGKEEFRESENSDVVRNPASKATYSASLKWSGGSWQMSELRLLS